MADLYPQKTLLDCWSPPQLLQDGKLQTAPVPVSFLSTTFTFDAEFFEEECLTRFLVMETEKENDGAAYLVEKEEKLAGLSTGLVLVDQSDCRGSRSLRWHLAPCRVQKGIMHAKITILHWSDCIRLIIGSANLTKPGYCINHEVFSYIDYTIDAETDPVVLSDVLDYLQEMTEDCCSPQIQTSYHSFQKEIREKINKWGLVPVAYKKDDVKVLSLLLSPRQKNGFERLRKNWDNSFNSPPDEAFIVSPFYDNQETTVTPSKKIAEILQQRGPVNISYYLPADIPDDEGSPVIVHGPSFLNKQAKENHDISFFKVPEQGNNEKNILVPRPMHMKQLWLQKADFCLLLMGSANFTSAAWGTGNRINYEANLLFLYDQSRNKEAKNRMHQVFPDFISLTGSELVFEGKTNEDEITEEALLPDLPLFFSEAILRKNESGYFLELTFNPEAADPPENFTIWHLPENEKRQQLKIFTQQDWLSKKPKKINIPWHEQVLPDSLSVNWEGITAYAFWPVLAESQSVLPPVEALRNLPLEALLVILSSSQPLYRLLKSIEKFKKEKPADSIASLLDPHQLIDTSRFLLQRTRRVSYAMSALRARLEKPVFTLESLNWRLYGPIGVAPLKDAIAREAKTPEEKHFLFAELALELASVSPQTTEISLSSRLIKSAIKKVLTEIEEELNKEESFRDKAIIEYSRRALKKSLYDL